MAVYNGTTGAFAMVGAGVLGGQTVDWNISTSADLIDSTTLGVAWDEFTTGLTDWNGTVNAQTTLAGDYLAVLGVSGAATFTVATGVTVIGTGIVASFTETVNVDAIGTISTTIEGNDTDGLAFALA